MLHTESIEVHDKLNPKLWVDEQLRDEVEEKLQEIVGEFILELKENNIPIKVLDAHLVGSNASYNYTKDSDLDVHIIASFDDVTCDPYILNLLYNYFKSYFNSKYDISIHGVPVELYVEDVKSNTVSNGIYSLFNNKWIKVPEPIDVPDVDISDDIEQYENMYHSAVDHNDAMEASQLIDDLYLLRRNSINTDGEYGVGNLIFKEFRNRGWIDNLKDVAAEEKSKQLSLEHLCEALDDMLSMENLIREAKARHVRPEDLFENDYDYLVDATEFFNYMVYGTTSSYRTSPEVRISKNRGSDQFYRTLLGFLDSIGTGEDYDKIEPASVKKTDEGLVPQDGRHRSKFCMLLGIPLPVKVVAGKNECLHTGVYKVLRKDKKGKRFPSSTKAVTKASKSLDEDLSSTTDIFNAVEDKFNATTWPPEGPTFLMPDGKFLDIVGTFDSKKSGRNFPCHAEVEDYLAQVGMSTAYADGSGSPTLQSLGVIRLNDLKGNNFIELSELKPTHEQYDGLEKWLDENSTYSSSVEVASRGYKEYKSYDYDDYTVDEIVSAIKRYYSSGKLYETVSVDNSQLIPLVEKEFGVSSFPVKGPTFLMPDGRFLTIADTFERRDSFEDFPCHAEVQDFLKAHDLTDVSGDYIDGSPVLSELGAIRINDIEEENNYIELSPKRPTPSQLESLLRHLDSNSARYRTVVVTDPGMNNFVTYDYGTTTTDDIVKNIKRYYASNILYEDFLDSEEKFWDYKTAPVDGKNIFDENRGESGYVRDMIKLAHSGGVNEDGKHVSIVQMSPKEYFEACAEGFGSTFSNQITSVKSDTHILQHLADVIQKYKLRFPITYLDYSYNRFNQEGRHRMYVAGELFGWDTKHPVMIIRTTDEATKAREEEIISRYIDKALSRTMQYEFVDLDDIKQQFGYDINYVMDDPKFDVKEDGDNYIFTVNGVSYPEPRSEFMMLEKQRDDEESYDDIDDIDLDLNESVQTNFTIDELKSIYKKFLDKYYKNNPELVDKVYGRVGEEDWGEMLNFFNSIEFPTEVYRGLSKDEVNTSNVGVNWTTDLDLFNSSNSTYKNSKAILKTKVNKDDINWEETVSNYIYYSLYPSYGLYPEHELTLKKSPSSDKVEITHRQ